MTEAELWDEYGAWLTAQNLPRLSADELLFDLTVNETGTAEQKAWLDDFIVRWCAVTGSGTMFGG